MTELPQRRERQDAVKNRSRILEVAQTLFDRDGVENVSMNRIAQEAGVGAGTLYRHFANKSDLCFALVQDQIISLAGELETLVAGKGSFRSKLREMVLRHQRFKENKAHLFKGMQQATLGSGGPMQSPVYDILRRPFAELFQRIEAQEGCGKGLDPTFRADVLLTALIGNSPQQQRIAHGLSPEEFADGICEIFYPREQERAH